jgi:hypothetical protein
MSHLVRPTSPPPDELDGLLRAFFQAEIPDPWPSLEAPAPRIALPVTPDSVRKGFWSSHLALAASVALLLGGSLFLSGSFSGGKSGPTIKLEHDSATHPSIHERGKPEKMREFRDILIDPKEGAFERLTLEPDDVLPVK